MLGVGHEDGHTHWGRTEVPTKQGRDQYIMVEISQLHYFVNQS